MQVQSNSNTQNDDAFHKLLSSQRELLNELRKEREEGGGDMLLGSPSKKTLRDGNTIPRKAVRTSSLDFLSKRLSIGFGADNFMGDAIMGDVLFDEFEDTKHQPGKLKKQNGVKKSKKFSTNKRKCKEHNRLSSMGFLSETFFEEFFPQSCSEVVEKSVFDAEGPASDDTMGDENFEPLDVSLIGGVDRFATPEISRPIKQERPKVDPEKLKVTFSGFDKAMQKSQKTQQEIHDWDRKMGLKRSHSKTMRLSSRSRKKIKAFFEKEVAAASPKSKKSKD